MRKRKFTTLAFYSLALVPLLGLGLGLHQYDIYKVTRETHKTTVDRNLSLIAYFSPSWTAFQADRARCFSVMVDGISN